ncbi:MAG: NAD(P)/FAD-dependent oxidoreductase [Thiohalobacterales bacterium]|nr:NAD(P)/FAD-dependent oxidoreductase [Thiohalobacterales bacterium]
MNAVTPISTSGNVEHFDVLIVGAGISGIGAAHHLQQKCPDKRFVILEGKASYGGTWLQHTYPGIRSDSDLYTFGYGFKPWTGKPVAEAGAILDYMGEVIAEDNTCEHIRYQHKVRSASWDSNGQRWLIEATNGASGQVVQFSAAFLWMCQGYYRLEEGYTPQWQDMESFKGPIVHPQTWPEDLDYKGKRVVVIGSGATAATLVPSMAADCEHLTMLQRSPTYFWTGENRNELADQLRELDTPEEWVHEIVRRSLLKQAGEIQALSESDPELVKQELFAVIRNYMGEDFDMSHFTPGYRPWQQRIAYVPDGDLFDSIKSGKVSVVTDHIERFTENGILTRSGELLEADIIITATGFNLSVMGDIPFDIDGEPVDFADTFTYRGMMNSGVPNMSYMFGYLRTSWTMRVDLVCDFICKLLNNMDALGATVVTPTPQPRDRDMEKRPWIEDEQFNSGYIQRGKHLLPKQGVHAPWTFTNDYYVEKDELPAVDVNEPELVYIQRSLAEAATR